MFRKYKPVKPILMSELFDGRLFLFGIGGNYDPLDRDPRSTLQEGQNYLIVYGNENVDELESCGDYDVGKILSAIGKEFETEIVADDDCRFWGFETQEQLEDIQRRLSNKRWSDGVRLFDEICEYVQNGRSDHLKPGTVEMLKADIVKSVAEYNPALLSARSKLDGLMKAVEDACHATEEFFA